MNGFIDSASSAGPGERLQSQHSPVVHPTSNPADRRLLSPVVQSVMV